MNTTHPPIVVKGRADKRQILIHSAVVKQTCKLGDSHYYSILHTGRQPETTVWKCEKINGGWYFDIQTIPNRAPKYYRNLFPSEDELIQRAKMTLVDEDCTNYIKAKVQKLVAERVSQEDINYYQFNQGYNRDTAIQLAEAKAWLEWITEVSEDRNYINIGIESKMDLYEYCLAILSEKKIKGIKISNLSALRNKIASYPRLADMQTRRLHIIHKGKGNDNANVVNRNVIVNEETGEVYTYSLHLTLIYSLFMNLGNGNKHYKKSLHQEYMQMLLDMGHNRVLSYSTFSRYTNEWEFRAKSSMERDGKKVFNDKYLPYVSAAPLRMKNSLWGGDGSSTKLYYNDGGKARSLMCYRIADIATRKILGYCLYKGGSNQKGESEEIVLHALKMAYKSTGIFAAELITDNGGCAGTHEFRKKMEMIFGKFTTISPGNSQENPTETVIKSMNNFGRRYKNWGGSSFNATQDANKNNPDYLVLSQLPTYEEAIQQAIEWIELWNAETRVTGFSPNELYNELESNPMAKEPIEQAYRYVFGNETQLDLSYQRGYVNIEYEGVEHQFTIPNFSDSMKVLSQRTGMKGTIDVMVKWEGDAADLYNLNREYILTCPRTSKAHKSYSEAIEDSWKNHGELLARKVEMVGSAEALTQEVSEAMSYLNRARTTAGVVKDEHNEAMEEIFNQRIANEQITLPMPKKKESSGDTIDAVMDLI